VSAKAANPFKTAVTATDTSKGEYLPPGLKVDLLNGNDPASDTQDITGGTAKFLVRITNTQAAGTALA
jgi:nucleoid-associated protein YgaU